LALAISAGPPAVPGVGEADPKRPPDAAPHGARQVMASVIFGGKWLWLKREGNVSILEWLELRTCRRSLGLTGTWRLTCPVKPHSGRGHHEM
jgi:hypothetical protein